MAFTSKHTGAQIEAFLDSVPNKQDKLVSGQSIKTINGQDILGEGDITIEGGGDTSHIEEIIESNEKVTAAALNDLNDRTKKVEAFSAEIETLKSDKATKEELASAVATLEEENVNLIAEIRSNEKVAAAALNDLNNKITNLAESVIGALNTEV